jgi:hypothetical protein
VPLCPDVRYLNADAPTDAAGVTYITFTGASDEPGVGTRDPARKWGHYDYELPVFVQGFKLPGRLVEAAANGSYILQIRNFDFTTAGLGAVMNLGETVTASEFNYMNAHSSNQPGPFNYWVDFDGNGSVGASDFNAFVAHQGHDCDSPAP